MYLGQFILIRCGNPSPNLGLVWGFELNLSIGPRWEICLGMLFTSKIKYRIKFSHFHFIYVSSLKDYTFSLFKRNFSKWF